MRRVKGAGRPRRLIAHATGKLDGNPAPRLSGVTGGLLEEGGRRRGARAAAREVSNLRAAIRRGSAANPATAGRRRELPAPRCLLRPDVLRDRQAVEVP